MQELVIQGIRERLHAIPAEPTGTQDLPHPTARVPRTRTDHGCGLLRGHATLVKVVQYGIGHLCGQICRLRSTPPPLHSFRNRLGKGDTTRPPHGN